MKHSSPESHSVMSFRVTEDGTAPCSSKDMNCLMVVFWETVVSMSMPVIIYNATVIKHSGTVAFGYGLSPQSYLIQTFWWCQKVIELSELHRSMWINGGKFPIHGCRSVWRETFVSRLQGVPLTCRFGNVMFLYLIICVEILFLRTKKNTLHETGLLLRHQKS